MTKNEEDFDVRSEMVRDYLERPPGTLIRWGTVVIAAVLVTAIVLTWFVRYPTLILSSAKLTTRIVPKPVVVRMDGRVEKLLAQNHQHVLANQMVCFLESTANHEDVLNVEAELETVLNFFEASLFKALDTLKLTRFEHLGDIQPSYQTFLQQFIQFNMLVGKEYFNKKKNLLTRDVSELITMNHHLKGQYQLYAKDVALAENEFAVNQKLFKEKVIARLDLDREESKVLAKRIPLKNIETSILTNNAQIRTKEREIIELDKQLAEQLESFRQSVNTLRSVIATWKNQYVLRAPASGELVFSGNLQEKEEVKNGTELFHVFESNSDYVGILTIPQINSGKIKLGQRVLLKFQSFPFEEYGLVEGKISSLPQLSAQDNESLFAMVEFPNGLTTNHSKVLSYNYGMTASAEIVTEELRLIERIFYTVRKIFV